jgi:hypothetical protein
MNRNRISGVVYALRCAEKNYCPCPYWNGHRDKMNRLLGDLLFDKWYKRPNSAYKLYWRMHPNEK